MQRNSLANKGNEVGVEDLLKIVDPNGCKLRQNEDLACTMKHRNSVSTLLISIKKKKSVILQKHVDPESAALPLDETIIAGHFKALGLEVRPLHQLHLPAFDPDNTIGGAHGSLLQLIY